MPDRSRVGPKLVHDGPPEESARPRHLPGPRPARSRHQRPPGSWRADAPAPRPPALDRFNPRIGPSHPHLTATRRVPVPRMRQSLTRHSNMRKILRWGYQGVSSTIRRSRTHPIPSEAGCRRPTDQSEEREPHLHPRRPIGHSSPDWSAPRWGGSPNGRRVLGAVPLRFGRRRGVGFT